MSSLIITSPPLSISSCTTWYPPLVQMKCLVSEWIHIRAVARHLKWGVSPQSLHEVHGSIRGLGYKYDLLDDSQAGYRSSRSSLQNRQTLTEISKHSKAAHNREASAFPISTRMKVPKPSTSAPLYPSSWQQAAWLPGHYMNLGYVHFRRDSAYSSTQIQEFQNNRSFLFAA